MEIKTDYKYSISIYKLGENMVGIVILNYNTWEITIECVKSIQNCDDTPKKIYIVDNNSLNDSYEMLKNYFKNEKNIEVIQSYYNSGFAIGNNIGIDRCLLDGINCAILTNNDIIFNRDSIKSMSEFIENNQNVVIVGPKIYATNGAVSHSTFLVEPNLVEYLGLYRKNLPILDEINIIAPTQVASVSGCCFSINIGNFKKMGAFDEGTFLYGEESILASQAKANDLKVYFLPSASVIHKHGYTTGKTNLFVEGELLKSSLYYWNKYKNSSNFQLTFIFIVLFSKTLLKVILGKRSFKGINSYLGNSLKVYLKELQSQY